ncbi:MAG: glycosyltransferase family A protein [Monoglobales bacterium]
MLTIFTPAYNRAYTLDRLYKSLCEQTDRNFEWLIVDDGSKDDTKELVARWIKEKRINIRYYYQENSGKPSAHNKGADLAKGELFVCVDSDDLLRSDAVEQIHTKAKELAEGLIGIISYKCDIKTKENITKLADETVQCASLKDLYDYHGLTGDTMLTFKTEIIRKYSFPTFEGEKFIPEGYLYDLIDKEGELLVLREALYGCEYMSDGYTAGMARLLYNNPKGYFTYINNRLKGDTSLKHKFLDCVRYDAMAIAHGGKGMFKRAVYPFMAVAAYPLGYAFYWKRYREYTRK